MKKWDPADDKYGEKNPAKPDMQHGEYFDLDDELKPTFAPNATLSALYAALCNADLGTSRCRFNSTITLSVELPCHGLECEIETVRVVEIRIQTAASAPEVSSDGFSAFYEYVRPPCVGLAFLEHGQGRFAEDIRKQGLVERLCLDPREIAGEAGCCSADRIKMSLSACDYFEELVSYERALALCEAAWPSPSPPPPSLPSPPAVPLSLLEYTWGLFPREYGNRSAISCPDGSRTATPEECWEAGRRAMEFGSEPHFDRPTNTAEDFEVEDRADMPPGCVVDARSARVRFNSRSRDGANFDIFKLVCNTTEGAAMYEGVGARLCPRKRERFRGTCEVSYKHGSPYNSYVWSEESCRPKAQIFYDGRVSLVTPTSKYDSGAPLVVARAANTIHSYTIHSYTIGVQELERTQVNSGSWFRVRWASGHAPVPVEGDDGSWSCPSSCEFVEYIAGKSCVCDLSVKTAAVFDQRHYGLNTSAVPAQADVEEALRIGAPSPDLFDDGTYALCTSSPCQAAGPSVKVYTRGGPEEPLLDETAIFEVVVNETARPGSGRVRRLANKASIVQIGENVYERISGIGGWGGECTCPDGQVYPVGDLGGCRQLACYGGQSGTCNKHQGPWSGRRVTCAYSFRNPPRMLTMTDPAQRDAIYETEALLEHILYHPNVAPFVSHRLIQRLVASNPSPRYTSAVAAAFRAGEYNGVIFSGRHGDLAATVAAILLDREARSLLLLSDPSHGHLREPLVKLLHLLRAMEFVNRDGREIELGGEAASLEFQIGQGVFKSPTVFNFFSPEYTPEGPLKDAGLVSPEAELAVLPYLVGYLNGVHSLALDGLTSCSGGFGVSCTTPTFPASWNDRNFGAFTFTPSNVSTEAVVEGLSLVLTGARLDEESRNIIAAEYSAALNASLCPNERQDLCGRLEPGQSLARGEYLTNAVGEVLCFTWDGVLRHIGADGGDVYSTAAATRGSGIDMRYKGGAVEIYGYDSRAGGTVLRWKWSSSIYEPGTYRAFHSFLLGPCLLLDAVALERHVVYGWTPFFGDDPTTTINCTAADACSTPAPAPENLPEYEAARARSDADYAIRLAQRLVASTAAFGITNIPGASTAVAAPPSTPTLPPTVRASRPYRALILFYMRGGCDSFNVLVPHSGCDDRNVAQQYLETRGVVALDPASLLQIDVPASNKQPCTKFGVHPELPTLQQTFADGEALWVANVGGMVEPMTKQEYLDKDRQIPAGIFAHDLMQGAAESLLPQHTTGETGILGRIIKALYDQAEAAGTAPVKVTPYSITSSRAMFRGSPVEPILLDSSKGMLTFGGSQTAADAYNIEEREATMRTLKRLAGMETESLYATNFNSAVRRALDDSEDIAAKLADTTLTQSWPRGSRLIEQLKQVSKVISAREALNAEVDLFYIAMGGFDHHSELLLAMQKAFREHVEPALSTFVAEMKAQGVWESVALQSMSEFGRTLDTNGAGTDHAWGGNHYLMGGSVNGGNIRGAFPELRVDGPQSLSSNAPMLPTSSWEAIWKNLAQWVGVEDSQLEAVMPNLRNFGNDNLIPYTDMFRS